MCVLWLVIKFNIRNTDWYAVSEIIRTENKRIDMAVFEVSTAVSVNVNIYWNVIHSLSILSDDRSKASSKTMPPHSAI